MHDRITDEGQYEPSFWLPTVPWYTRFWRKLLSEDQEQTVAEREAAEDATAPAEGAETRSRTTRAARNHGALPSHLPRHEVVIDVAHEACPCCGGKMHCIGEVRTEQLDIVPAQLRVRVTRRPRYACRNCEEAVVIAEAPCGRRSRHIHPGQAPSSKDPICLIWGRHPARLPLAK
jgi:hypothetical protein